MSLRTLDLPLLLKPSDQDLFRDFFVPALTHAFRCDRSVGYIASGWLRRAWFHWQQRIPGEYGAITDEA
jgi:hypothetical protein